MLAVTVVRVGTLALPPDSFITPRSLVLPPEELSEPAALDRLRGMVGDKHYEFMLHEKQARITGRTGQGDKHLQTLMLNKNTSRVGGSKQHGWQEVFRSLCATRGRHANINKHKCVGRKHMHVRCCLSAHRQATPRPSSFVTFAMQTNTLLWLRVSNLH